MALRVNGRRLTYIAFGVILAAGVVYLFLSGGMQNSAPGLIVAAFVGLGALGLLAGIGMNLIGRTMRRSAAAFVGDLK